MSKEDTLMIGKLSLTETEDADKYISEKGIEILNLCHIPEDGRLKTLAFAASDAKRVHEILEFGERVDGSSLFAYIDPDKSDVYITPRLDTAFLNPFSTTPTLNILCRYLDENGKPLDIAPQTILSKAEAKLHSSTRVVLKALAELEFYIISKEDAEPLFFNAEEKHYHESTPFSKFGNIRDEILVTLTNIGINTKYAHAEVGKIQGKKGTVMEQHEIELTPRNLAETADAIAIAKWVIRNVCAKHCVSVSFSPKVSLKHAGNGMHIHLCGLVNGKNIVSDPNGNLSSEAKKMIGGILKFAASLAAFGNPTPISYFRLVSRKESPMHICWSAQNRLALIRIPLWWNFNKTTKEEMDNCKRTFEYRAPDPTANAHLLLAGITVAIDHGLNNSKETLQIAENLHLEKARKGNKPLKALPQSCNEAATCLQKDRKYYEAERVFPKTVIDATIKKLKSYNDGTLFKKVETDSQIVEGLLTEFLHYA